MYLFSIEKYLCKYLVEIHKYVAVNSFALDKSIRIYSILLIFVSVRNNWNRSNSYVTEK